MATELEAFRVFEYPVEKDEILFCPSCSYNNPLDRWEFIETKANIGLACPECVTVFGESNILGKGDFYDLQFQNNLVEKSAILLLRQIVKDLEEDRAGLDKYTIKHYKKFLDNHG